MYKFCAKFAIFGLVITIIGAIGLGVVAGLGLSISDINYTFDNIFNNSYDHYIDDEYATTTVIMTASEESIVDGRQGDTIVSSSVNDVSFNSIDIDFNVGNIDIYAGEEFSISGYGVDVNSLSYSFDNDTLKISYDPDITNIFNSDNSTIYINVPMKVYENVKVTVNSGTCYIYDVVAENFNFDANACSLNLSRVTVNASSNFDLSASNANFNSCKMNNLDVSVDVGELCAYDFDLTGDTQIDANLGNVEIGIINHERSEYLITSQSTGGNINISGDLDENVKSVYTIDVDNSLGSCNIYFY